MKLISLDVTNVVYMEGDKIGKLLAFISVFPIFIMVFYASCLLTRRELSIGFIFVGQWANEFFNHYLKNTWKEPRPYGNVGDGYGSPSSHSQFMGYVLVIGSWYLWSRMEFEHNFFKFPLTLVLLAICGTVCYFRYYLNYHTIEQISLGFQIGVIFGLVWLILVEVVFRYLGGFQWLETVFPFNWWYFKDTANVGNILKLELQSFKNNQQEKIKLN